MRLGQDLGMMVQTILSSAVLPGITKEQVFVLRIDAKSHTKREVSSVEMAWFLQPILAIRSLHDNLDEIIIPTIELSIYFNKFQHVVVWLLAADRFGALPTSIA